MKDTHLYSVLYEDGSCSCAAHQTLWVIPSSLNDVLTYS
nr:MAG TPA: hypothetical protein [Bacteriophage sp.]DAY83965.1 MAG TPA: hypothetical protein [Caudoviricetes sp.]